MPNRVSVTTLGGGRRAVSPKPKTSSTGKASHGGVSTNLISHRSSPSAVAKNSTSLASRPGKKPGTTHRVGMMGTARAGGNPRAVTPTRHSTSSKGVTSKKSSGLGRGTSGIRVSNLSVAGGRSKPARGTLGNPRGGLGVRKVQSKVSKVRSHTGHTQTRPVRSALHKTPSKNPIKTRHSVKSSASRPQRNGLKR